MTKTTLLAILIPVTALLLFVLVEWLLITHNGQPVAVPSIPRQTETIGAGPVLKLVVLGDSTAVSQGSDYREGYAWATAQALSSERQVQLTNVAISGATTESTRDHQLTAAADLQPDLVILAVGANDVTHLHSLDRSRQALETIISTLKTSNSAVRIVLTGSPAMETPPRLPWPVDQLMGYRTVRLNQAFREQAKPPQIAFAPIADQTRETFAADPTLFAVDKFHPNARGYAVWTPIIIDTTKRLLAGDN